MASGLSTISFEDVLDRRNLTPAYQPVVDLMSGETVGYEALARWPALGIDPSEAFEWAARVGGVAELDRACRAAAITGAVDTLAAEVTLFVNIEPSALTSRDAAEILALAGGRLRLVAEITERALLRRPAELLRTVGQLRAAGCGIALDDVGAAPESLTLLPFVRPDVIKLDLSLIQRWPGPEQAAILTAVAAQAERSGAVVLAEGIETEAHREQALALGASLGQGWLLGRPAGPSGRPVVAGSGLSAAGPPPPSAPTPFSLVEDRPLRVAPKGLLLAISHHLENRVLALDPPPVVLSTFQEARHFTPFTEVRYRRLAAHCPLVAVIGAGLAAAPAPGVRGADLEPDDALRDEWTVVVVGDHYAGALISQDLGDTGPDLHRRFAYAVTHDHDTVMAAARSLLQRVVASDSP
ncbi:EAL domain-containing protein [Acidiferrimicrobium sp. IK]|uniref:sensor domain-containing phosphodiesterase n=1 Tax=Acidiferrimicrobium sp. IK TaxID=2871700 RepID=UPI0021CB780B|nr:EAL domain-containing protein [Acidiferrimicrobium sp. IK]MCU4182782.1 EAL domain-containing protein [Acidiferrimicrobium sp. IK]